MVSWTDPGQLALSAALLMALFQILLPLPIAVPKLAAQWDQRLKLSQLAAIAQFLLLALSFAWLIRAFLLSDFSYEVVAQNSHRAKPFLYKFAGSWGNHEGSLLLWLLMLAFFGALVAFFGRNLPARFRLYVLSVQAFIGAGFLLFALLTSNPFTRLSNPPAQGLSLNPLLQDPGLAFHPPFLYAGYVGFSVAFSFSIAALIDGKLDDKWARWTRPWTLLAWSLLTLGIAMGAWWAYYELGWGGFWYWDPVENASLMPWIAGTILLHCLAMVEKRKLLKRWAVLMALTAFSTSILGTFLVRSGLLTSVHAFANDPDRGRYLLMLFGLYSAGGFALFAFRASTLRPEGAFAFTSRESAILINNLLLLTLLVTVAFGTFWPSLAEVLFAQKVSVGPPYFHETAVPLAGMTLLVMGIAFGLSWKRTRPAALIFFSILPFFLAFSTALLLLFFAPQKPFLSALWIFLGLWVIFSSFTALARDARLLQFRKAGYGTDATIGSRALPRPTFKQIRMPPFRLVGGQVAHIGLGLCILGVLGASYWHREHIAYAQPGSELAFAGYHFKLVEIEQFRNANYLVDEARFRVEKNGNFYAYLTPQRRFYPAAGQETTEAAIKRAFLSDLYLTIGPGRDDNPEQRVVRLTYHPLVSLIWSGALIMAFGGLLALLGPRRRKI